MIKVSLFLKKFDKKASESTRVSIDSKEFPKPNSYEEFISKIAKAFNIKKRDIILNAITNDEEEYLIKDQQALEDYKDETIEYQVILENKESLSREPSKTIEENKEAKEYKDKKEGQKQDDSGDEMNKGNDKSKEEDDGEDELKIKINVNLDISDKEIENIISSQIKDIPPIDDKVINDDPGLDIEKYKEEMNIKYDNIKSDFNKAFDSKIDEIVINKNNLMQSKISNSILEFSNVNIKHLEGIKNEANGLKDESTELVENTQTMSIAIEKLSEEIPVDESDPNPKINIIFKSKDFNLEIKKGESGFITVSDIEIENVGNETYKKLYFVADESNSSKEICFWQNSKNANINQLSLNGDFSPKDTGTHTINLKVSDAKPNQTYSLIIYVKEDIKKRYISKPLTINVKIKGEENVQQKSKEDEAELLYKEFESKYDVSLINTKEELIKKIMSLNSDKNQVEEWIKKKLEEKDENLFKELNMTGVCDINEAKKIFNQFNYNKEQLKNWIKEKNEENIKSKAEEKYNSLNAALNLEDKIEKNELIDIIVKFNFDAEKINDWIKAKIPQAKPEIPIVNPDINDDQKNNGGGEEDPKITEIISKFDDEYNILTIIDEDEFKQEIIKLKCDESKIREYIEKKLNE